MLLDVNQTILLFPTNSCGESGTTVVISIYDSFGVAYDDL